jgi:hypothetical protein
MIFEQFTNGVQTTLNGSINNSTTTVVVTDASSFPTEKFRIRVEGEIMYCTSRSTNTLTVVRGSEGTTAASHGNSTIVNHVVTTATLDNIRKRILSDCAIAPYNASPFSDDDNFDDESFTGWTTVSSTPALVSAVEQNHRYSVVIPTGTATGQYYAFMKAKTPSANDWVQAGFYFQDNGTQYPLPALFMANGATWNAGKQIAFGYSPHETVYILRDMTGYNAHVSNTSYGTINPWQGMFHMRLQFVSNDHWSAYISADGIGWAKLFNNVALGSMGAAPTHMGFGFTTWGASREYNMGVTYCHFSF